MSCAVADDGSCDAPAAPIASSTAVAMVAVSKTLEIFMLISRVSDGYTTGPAFDARSDACLTWRQLWLGDSREAENRLTRTSGDHSRFLCHVPALDTLAQNSVWQARKRQLHGGTYADVPPP